MQIVISRREYFPQSVNSCAYVSVIFQCRECILLKTHMYVREFPFKLGVSQCAFVHCSAFSSQPQIFHVILNMVLTKWCSKLGWRCGLTQVLGQVEGID